MSAKARRVAEVGQTLVQLRAKKRAREAERTQGQPPPSSEHGTVRHIETAYPKDVNRPKTRGDCLPGGINEARPCPFVSCKYHTYLDVNPLHGSLKINITNREPHELEHSCALDVADQGGVTLEEVAQTMGVVRERVRQIEEKALLRGRAKVAELEDSGDA